MAAKANAESNTKLTSAENGMYTPANNITVFDIDSLARSVSGMMLRAGVAPGAPVGFVAPNGSGFLAGLVGCLRNGNTAILIDQRTAEPEVHRILERLSAHGTLRCAAENGRARRR